MLSGTASQDFGGKHNAGIAVGIIDGFVYFGTVFQSVLLGRLLPHKGTAEAADIGNWYIWPIAMIPVAVIGLYFSLKVWNAKTATEGLGVPAANRRQHLNSGHPDRACRRPVRVKRFAHERRSDRQ